MQEEKKEVVTLGELLTHIKSLKDYILKQWKIVLTIAVIGGIIGFAKAYFASTIYKAELTFALDEKNSGGGALENYAGIASQFGIDLSTGGGGAFVGENIIELMKSKLIVDKTLLTELEIDGKKDLLLNRYIDFYKLRDKWAKKDTAAANVKFVVNIDRDKLNLVQERILGVIRDEIKENQLTLGKNEKKLNIVSVKFSSEDEQFAKLFSEQLVRNVTDYYIETKTRKAKKNILRLQLRLDSVKRELDAELFGFAINQDENQNLIRSQARIPGTKRQMNLQLLTQLYGELVKNLELSKLNLSQEEPLVQVIDTPRFPLAFTKPSIIVNIIGGGFVGLLLSVLILSLRRIFYNFS